jgi:autotransporter-associated beta strand protein
VTAGTLALVGNTSAAHYINQVSNASLTGNGNLAIGGNAAQAVNYELNFNSAVMGTGTLTLNPGSQLTTYASNAATFTTDAVSAPVVLVTDGTAVPTIAANLFGALTVSGSISGSSGLNAGATATSATSSASLIGKTTFTGNSTYTGNTSILAGTLVVNGSLTGNGTINGTVNVNAAFLANTTALVPTLAGSGTIAEPVVVNGAITAGSGSTATDTIGTLHTGTTTFNGTGNASSGYIAKIGSNGSGNDTLVVSGLSINSVSGAFDVTLQNTSSGVTLTAGSQIVLALDQNSGQTGVFANAIGSSLVLVAGPFVPSDGTSALKLAEVDLTNSGGEELVLDVGTVATPEPTSLLLLGLVGGPLVLGRRRRTRVAGG